MQKVFHPELADMKLLRKIISSFADATTNEKERHYTFISEYIWKTITQLVEQAAYHLTKVTNKEDRRQSKRVVVTPGQHQTKKSDTRTQQKRYCIRQSKQLLIP
jgi:hypothetical protein